MIKDCVGLILVLTGGVLGLWLGFWVCLVGGIVQIFSNIDPLNLTEIGWGVAKYFISGIVGQISALTFVIPGLAILNTK